MIDRLTYGHYILTSRKPGDELQTRERDYIAAGTVNWATQVSFDPPMLAVAVGRKSDLNETIDYSGHFALHLLGKENRGLIQRFAGDSEITDREINGVPYAIEKGEVALRNTLGRLVAKVQKSFNAGDHTVYVAEVVRQDTYREGVPIGTMDTKTRYEPEVARI